jgi:hypothetical protein
MDTGSFDVEAWSLGVAAINADIVAATVAGTAAEFASFQQTELTTGASNEGIVSATIPDFFTDALASSGTYSLLEFTLQGFAPANGIIDAWHVDFYSGLQGSGQIVETIASVAGQRYLPTLQGLTIEVIGDSSVAPIPEPSTMLLLGTGLVGLVGFRKKIKK